MSIRVSPSLVITPTATAAVAAHVNSQGTSHALVKDGNVKSVHSGVVLVAGSLNEIESGLNGTAGSKFRPTQARVTLEYLSNPAYLRGGMAPTTTIATWNAVADGEFQITFDGGAATTVTGLNFAAALNMDDVAAIIQTGIRAVTLSTETCIYDVDHFVITSASTDPAVSAITVAATVGAPAGTDISGAGATNFMDCDAGNGIPYLPPEGTSARISIGTTSGGTDILPASTLTGLISGQQVFIFNLVGLFPEIEGNAHLFVKATAGDGQALVMQAQVTVMGYQT